jgi:hypothetical protein
MAFTPARTYGLVVGAQHLGHRSDGAAREWATGGTDPP